MAMAKKSKATKSKAKKSKARKTKKAKKTGKPAGRAAASRGKTKTSKAKTARKAARPKAKARKAAPARKKQIVGEGDYQASRTFLKDQSSFVKRHASDIPAMGKDAEAALEGSEGSALRAAEEDARSHSKAPGE